MSDPGPVHARRTLVVAVATTVLVTGLARLLPDAHAATAVGLAFLGVTYVVALRTDDVDAIRADGLGLGGLMEPDPLDARRLLSESLRALGWALAVAAVVFPPFWFGWKLWWRPHGVFVAAALPAAWDEVMGQLLVIALPEEAFYRGYLQSSLERAWRPRWRVLGADLGPGWLVTCVLFALGHFATEAHPNRLAVFFPALLFGWLRARSGGIGAAVALHALSNLLTAYLAKSYGLSP